MRNIVRAGYIVTKCTYAAVWTKSKGLEYSLIPLQNSRTSSIKSLSIKRDEYSPVGDRIEYSILLDAVDDMLREETPDESKLRAYQLLKNAESKFKEQTEFMWRLALATLHKSLIAGEVGDKEEHRKCAFASFELIEEVMKRGRVHAQIKKVYSFSSSLAASFMGLKARIDSLLITLPYLKEVIQENPKDADALHCVGRMYYEISQLNWMQCKFVSSCFTELPEGDLDEGLEMLLKSDSLRKDTKMKNNSLFIAKCYLTKNDNENALKWLKTAKNAPSRGVSDIAYEKEIDSLLNWLRNK